MRHFTSWSTQCLLEALGLISGFNSYCIWASFLIQGLGLLFVLDLLFRLNCIWAFFLFLLGFDIYIYIYICLFVFLIWMSVLALWWEWKNIGVVGAVEDKAWVGLTKYQNFWIKKEDKSKKQGRRTTLGTFLNLLCIFCDICERIESFCIFELHLVSFWKSLLLLGLHR